MNTKTILPATLFFLVVIVSAYAWVPKPIVDDPLVRMPGTQPNTAALEGPGRCLNCHEGYDQQAEPGSNWKGSMMAQAARDPIFWACFTVALQDSVWAVGNANAGDLCERCHFPEGWLEGRSDPPNATAMTGSDYDGIHCDFCHRMYDPFFESTYDGTREGNDWINYWDEAGNTGPSSGTLAQTAATNTYLEDIIIARGIKLFSGQDFFNKFNFPASPEYVENASGQFFVSPNAEKRASFSDHGAKHKVFYSRYHKSKYMCATCHDVSNPVLANLGASGLPDNSGGTSLITEQYSASRYFHVERTFSEFMLSDYGDQGGAGTNPEFSSQTGISHVSKCQDCHMRDVTGHGANKSGIPLRPNESSEHPNSGIPQHDMTGGNAWISHILASLDPTGPVYDARNVEILEKGPAVLTLDLNLGESPKLNGPALKRGSDRAKDQLSMAASIKDLDYNPYSGQLSFKVQNNTGHKLISGFPEGRRMFVNIKAYYNDQLLHEINPYDQSAGTMKGLAYSSASPSLLPTESYSDEIVYEAQTKSDLTGEEHTFHFVLATGRYKDNRIPPKGFDISRAAERIVIPVWHGLEDPNYFSTEEYTGGYDEVEITTVKGANKVVASVYYQGTSREYIEFLRDEINGSDTLSSPTPSGEASAYIAQTDPMFAQLKEWGNTIWDLWYHNHGLDGSGVNVDGIVPFEMARAEMQNSYTVIPGDFDHDGDVDMDDLATLATQWLSTSASSVADIAPAPDGDGIVNYLDFEVLVENWTN